MNKLAIAVSAALVLSTSPVIAGDETIMFEIGVGFGTSIKVTKTKEQLANKFNRMFCYHRPSDTPIYGAVRYRYDNVEAHVGGWLVGADSARCDRDSYAVGVGYVFDTQDHSGEASIDDFYATYTPGIAYTWGRNKEFNIQDNTNTNWRLKDNFQFYNRVAIGGGNESTTGEIGIVRYGNPIGDYERTGETFVTISAGFRDYDGTSGSGAGATDPGDDAGIINTINIVDNTNTVDGPLSEVTINNADVAGQANNGNFDF